MGVLPAQVCGVMASLNVVICTPYRPTPSRNTLWDWVRDWIADHYPYPVFVADSFDDDVFSPAQARNNAARLAGDWDVAVFHDADTIANMSSVTKAVDLASRSMRMVVAGDKHMYCSPESTEQIMAHRSALPAEPDDDGRGLYTNPCSGVFAVSRKLWDAVGGYVEGLHGWGYEDLVFLQMCGIWGDGNTWIPGHTTYHLWHPPSERDAATETNKAVWQQLTRYRRNRDPQGARHYLASLGHKVP